MVLQQHSQIQTFLAVGIVFGNAVKYMGLFGAILFIIIVGATAILLKGRQKPQQ